jgi:RNA polymerase sigma factor (sigma-70 family)
MNDPEDSAVLVRALLSDERFIQMLRTHILKMCRNYRSLIDVDDLLQDVVIKALVSREAFAGHSKGELFAWLKSIAHSRLVDQLRRQSRHSTTELIETQRVDRPQDAFVDDNDWLSFVTKNLNSFEIEFINAHYRHGLSLELMASILGKKPNTVRQIHHRILKKIRREASDPK